MCFEPEVEDLETEVKQAKVQAEETKELKSPLSMKYTMSPSRIEKDNEEGTKEISEERRNIDERLANLTNQEVVPTENTQDKDDVTKDNGFSNKSNSNSEELMHNENRPYEKQSTE